MQKVAILFSIFFLSHILFAEGFTVSSNNFKGQISNNQVFSGFGCTGKNISPDVSWKNAPKDTKSFAITIHDPDAPTGGGWWHWVVFNLSKSTSLIKTNSSQKKALPKEAIESLTSFGNKGFGGACPPAGDKSHQYILTVYALSVDSLDLNENSQPNLVGYMLNANALAKSSIIAYYQR